MGKQQNVSLSPPSRRPSPTSNTRNCHNTAPSLELMDDYLALQERHGPEKKKKRKEEEEEEEKTAAAAAAAMLTTTKTRLRKGETK
ncbi:hypothetical protein ACOMHN_022924 [Nucella lapillus]